MGIVLEFSTKRKKPVKTSDCDRKKTAEILFFSGVRYSRDTSAELERADAASQDTALDIR
jgi:hypothetical protein